jgi:hypothetical protein
MDVYADSFNYMFYCSDTHCKRNPLFYDQIDELLKYYQWIKSNSQVQLWGQFCWVKKEITDVIHQKHSIAP